MQRIIIDKPYRFIPSRNGRFWSLLLKLWLPRYLRKEYGMHACECIGAEKLQASLHAGHGVLLAANHIRPCDPLVIGNSLRPHVRCDFSTMDQCRASASGLNGGCAVNWRYTQAQIVERPAKRRYRDRAY